MSLSFVLKFNCPRFNQFVSWFSKRYSIFKSKSSFISTNKEFEENFNVDKKNNEIVSNKKKNKKKIFTKIELNQVKKIEGPIFSEEDDGVDEATKVKKEEQKKPQSFLSRYWYIIAMVMIMMMMNGGGGQDPQQGQGQQGQGQGQQAGATGNTNAGK